MTAELRHRVRVGYIDTDQGGVAHHSAYLRWLEEARVEFFRARGVEYKSVEDAHRLALPVVEAHLRYRRPARFDDLLDVTCRVGELGRAALRMESRVLRGDDVLCEAQIRLACITLPEGKLQRLPAWLCQACSRET